MDNNTYYQKLLLSRYSDIALGSTILIIIGGVIGVIGNITIIFLYFFRIKEKGERHFIPLLAIVDLLGCLASPPYYILDNEYLYNYPSFIGCRILTFLQICIPGMSGHTLLLISIQRYMLVCKPFGPKMTLFWKRVSFGIVCLVSLVYSFPLLATAGVYEEVIPFMNQTVTTEVCKFFSGISMPMTAYVILLFVFMVVNIVLTVGFYIPVLMRIAVSLRFSSNKYEVNRDSNAYSHGESSQATRTSEIDIGSTGPEKIRSSIKMKDLETNKNATTSTKRVHFESSDQPSEQPITTVTSNNFKTISPKPPFDHTVSSPKSQGDMKGKSKTNQTQRRISIMFFLLIVTYVLSYTPALVFEILFHMLDDFKFVTMTRVETGLWFYMTRLVFLNHIVNPLVYGCFDNKFRQQLYKLFTRKK
ncbi:uncharacterized protein LOC111110281 [Crassostrea virginica]